MELLAHLYRCSPSDLLDRDPEGEEGAESELARQLAAASPEQREQATAVLSALLKSRR